MTIGTHEHAYVIPCATFRGKRTLLGFGPRKSKTRTLSVEQLIDECPDHAPFAGDKFRRAKGDCLLLASDRSLVVDRVRRPDWGKIGPILGTSLYASALVGSAACAEACDGSTQKIANVSLAALSIPILISGIYVLTLIGR